MSKRDKKKLINLYTLPSDWEHFRYCKCLSIKITTTLERKYFSIAWLIWSHFTCWYCSQLQIQFIFQKCRKQEESGTKRWYGYRIIESFEDNWKSPTRFLVKFSHTINILSFYKSTFGLIKISACLILSSRWSISMKFVLNVSFTSWTECPEF